MTDKEPYSADDIKRKKPFGSFSVPIIKDAAIIIVSAEGLPITSTLIQYVDKTEIAAMTAALYALSKSALIEINNDDFHQLYIKGSKGYLMVIQADSEAALISSKKTSRLTRSLDSFYHERC